MIEKKKKLEKKLKLVRNDEVNFDSNANNPTNVEESITVPVKNSFQQLSDLEELDDQFTRCTASPVLSAPWSPTASPPPSNSASTQPTGSTFDTAYLPADTSTSASSSGQLGLIKTGILASKDETFKKNLWKYEFCDQTFHCQNTFDQVFHTRGHKKEI